MNILYSSNNCLGNKIKMFHCQSANNKLKIISGNTWQDSLPISLAFHQLFNLMCLKPYYHQFLRAEKNAIHPKVNSKVNLHWMSLKLKMKRNTTHRNHQFWKISWAQKRAQYNPWRKIFRQQTSSKQATTSKVTKI